jgi:tripartite-type tricarboxylate transporter receptor subunit TctC
MSTLLTRCSEYNHPLGNRGRFCPRCGTRQPRDPALLALASALMCAGITIAHAADGSADYPAKPVRVIVTFPPGGGTDLMARTIGHKLADAWGKPIVVDNRAGAGGIIGTEIAARAAPDGYTLLLAT